MVWGQQADIGISPELIAMQDIRNAQVMAEIIDRPIRERSREIASARESYSRKLLERRLPRRLHWILDRPRVLRFLFRLVPRWKPAMSLVSLDCTATAETGVLMSERWLQEQEARGRDVSGGHVFTYTDANGLPAEVYGP